MLERDPSEVKILLLPIGEAANFSPELCRAAFPERYARAGSMKNEDDRFACVAAGALLAAAGIAESDIVFLPLGKPKARNVNFCFNIAHDRTFAVLAVAPCEVGVDTEQVAPPRPSSSRWLTEEEKAWVCEGDAAERTTLLWTLKESVAKCDGRGLAIGFGSFSVLPLTRGEPLTLDGKNYYGHSFSVDGCLVSAVLTEKYEKIDYEILGGNACLDAMKEISERKGIAT